MLRLTTTSGETIVGTPNYVTLKLVDLRVPACKFGFRSIHRAQIARIERVKRS